MQLIISILLNGLAVVISAYVLPGVKVDGFLTAILVAIVLAIVSVLVKPFIVLLTLPINILTLGLFSLVINALMILLVTAIVPGFRVDGFWWAILFSIVLSVVTSIISTIVPEK